MIDPLSALIVAGLAAGLAVLLLWPRSGFLWKGLAAIRSGDRVRIEDALKHLYDCEYRRRDCTLQSLSGALGLGGRRATELLRRLEELELVHSEATAYRLTTEGRSYALRIIRIHRLWERYLSEETGFSPSEWHFEAETREHRTSREEAESLAASLGYPRYDPHGDPIPTSAGEIEPQRGKPLSDFTPNTTAEIVHVEDEPHAVYAQLLAEGLHPGMRLRVLENTPQRIRFEADAEEHVLAPVVADNLWAMELPEPTAEVESVERLSELRLGESATVIGISSACRGSERRRLLDLGVIPGSIIEAEMRSPSGDPIAYNIRGAFIALRREQTELIHIDRAGGEVSA
jgi:DtxR family Mn-dependent transcriptional regulator